MKWRSLLFLFVGLLGSCVYSNVFEKNVSLKGFKWNEKNIPAFTFNITDTTSDYDMYFLMRHTEAYPYSNIWLNIKTIFPDGDSSAQSKIEIPLANEDGKWSARGFDEIWEHRSLIASPLHFSKPGAYTIRLQHIMRVETLPEIISIGIRLEKANSPK